MGLFVWTVDSQWQKTSISGAEVGEGERREMRRKKIRRRGKESEHEFNSWLRLLKDPDRVHPKARDFTT